MNVGSHDKRGKVMIREIKNKALRRALDKEGLKDVTLYKNGSEGYFYITCDKPIYDSMFCIYSFNECTIDEWVKLIKDKVNG